VIASVGNPAPVRSPVTAAQVARRGAVAVRVAWLAMLGLVLALFVAGVPVIYEQLRTTCVGVGCQAWQRPTLAGVSPEFFAVWFIGREAVFAVCFFSIAAMMVWRAGSDRMALIGAFVLVAFGGATYPDTVAALGGKSAIWSWPVNGVSFLGAAGLLVFLYQFPDGRFTPGWTRWAAVIWTTICAAAYISPVGAPFNAHGQPFFYCFLLFACSAIGAQIRRYLTVATVVQRQQTKWVVLGCASAVAGLIVAALVLPQIGPEVISNRRMFGLVGMTIATLFLLLIPLSIGLAMIRYRLWDVDLLVNRALVYGALTGAIVGLYVVMVVGVGALVPTKGGPIVQLVITGVICLVFQPARVRVQRRVNRLLYGERDDPYAVLSRLGHRLGETLTPESILPTIVETVSQALRVPYAAIAMRQGEVLVPAARIGEAMGETEAWPLRYGDEAVGELEVATRAPGEPFGAADRRLLDDLARQAGVAIHAVRLNADVRRSREQVIGAREEERRRLRRDLHDGLGSHLASQTLTLDTARKLMPRDPAAADALLDELRGHIQAAVIDIRRLVNALRPPALDDLGLVAALREGARYYEAAGLTVTFTTPESFPVLPAAVEVAAYRIAQEALTNVVRHAEASHCLVTIAVDAEVGRLRLEIDDDGRGLPASYRPGVGLESMQNRATELGGTWTIETGKNGGTRLRVNLPLTEIA